MGLDQFLAPRSAVPIPRSLPVHSSVTAVTDNNGHQSGPYPASAATMQRYGDQTRFPYPSGSYDHWPYQTPFSGAHPPHNAYGYGYYPAGATVSGSSSHYNGYPYTLSQYPSTQLQWQQPYQSQGHYRQEQPQQHGQPSGAQTGDPSFKGASPLLPVAPPKAESPSQTEPPAMSGSVHPEQGPNDVGVLASLQPAQIEELLRNNPQLRDVVLAAINDAKKALQSS
jgi:hypothetical protein